MHRYTIWKDSRDTPIKTDFLHGSAAFKQSLNMFFWYTGKKSQKKAFAYTVKEKLGYDPIVVTEQSEYILEKDEIVDSRIIENDGLQEEIISNTQDTLTDIHSRIEDILYNAKLAVGKDISPAKMTKINNLVMELEKSTINLGAVINEEDRDKNPAEGLA